MPLPLRYNVRNVLVRRWTSAFTAGGIALVVAVTMLLAALVGGLKHMLVATGEPENLIVLRKGSTNDGSSFLPREAAQVVRQLAGVARGPDGEPLASAAACTSSPGACSARISARSSSAPASRRATPTPGSAAGSSSGGAPGRSSASSTRAARPSTARSGPTSPTCRTTLGGRATPASA